MKYLIWFKVSRPLVKDSKYMYYLIKHYINKHKIKNYKQGFRLLDFDTIISGETGDDFRNMIAHVRIECTRYKIPRFIKNYLLKK